MASDRMEEHSFPITHETLAAALGVRRSGVSIILSDFERRALITRSRGIMTKKAPAGCLPSRAPILSGSASAAPASATSTATTSAAHHQPRQAAG
jgi:hypothetical protein